MGELKSISLAVVFLPLGAAILAGLCGKKMGRKWTHRITNAAVGIAFILSFLVLKEFIWEKNETLNFTLYTWGRSGPFNFQIGFLIDQLTALMMVVVTFISWMVHIY